MRNSTRSGILASLLLGLLLTSCRVEKQPDIPEDLAAFADQFAIAHVMSEDNPEAYWQLLHWESTADNWKLTVQKAHYFEQDLKIETITFDPWEERDLRRFFPEGMIPNLTPEWIMKVEYLAEPKHQLLLPVGKTDQQWKIVQPISKS